jgi:hypothetical protein
MQIELQKRTLAEIYSGMAKLLSHSGHGARIESVPGRIRAVGTNHQETLVYEAETPENEHGEGTLVLPTEHLKEIVGAYGADTIVAFSETGEGGVKAEWETKGLVSSRTFSNEDGFPEIKFPGDKSFKTLDRDRFQKEYGICAQCTTPERARFDLDCIALDGDAKMMLATDGRQVYEAQGVDFPWKGQCYLPTGKNFPEKLLLSNGTLEAAKTKEVLAFRNGPWTYLVGRKEANFAPLEELSLDIADTDLLLIVSEEDAERLIELLPHLPGKERRSFAVNLVAEETITLHGESNGAEGEAEGQFALTSSHWIGGRFEISFNREYFIRALNQGFRLFRFHAEGGPVVSEDGNGKYIFMPMRIRDETAAPEQTESESDETPEASKEAKKPAPAEVRKRRLEWLKREALWLASRYADELGDMNLHPGSTRLKTYKNHLQRVFDRLASLAEKRRKKDDLTFESLIPATQTMEWEELGLFMRRDGTGVELVRSKDGFFSLRDEDGEANITLEDMATLFEPLLEAQWKPFALALYFNGQCWWTEAEFLIERNQKAAKRSLLIGVSRPAKREHLEWELKLLGKLLSTGDLAKRTCQETNARVDQISAWIDSGEPETLDLLPLCMAFAGAA